MREGTYSRWLMVDLIDTGWCGSPMRHYIGVLWGSWNKDKTERKTVVTTMSINSPWKSQDGRSMGETTQFQNIFRLLNEDKLILPSQYNDDKKWHKLWIDETKDIIKNNSLNFFVVFEKDVNKPLKVCDILNCDEDIIKNDGKWEWKPAYKAREVKQKEKPGFKTRSLYKKSAVVTGETGLQMDDRSQQFNHTVPVSESDTILAAQLEDIL
jgi:hypothetical protein